MSACSMLTFNNVTPAIWQCGVDYAKDHGVTITGNSGSVSKSGYTIYWNYNPQSQVCKIQCTDSPTFVPCIAINAAIQHVVEGCFAQHNAVLKEMVEA